MHWTIAMSSSSASASGLYGGGYTHIEWPDRPGPHPNGTCHGRITDDVDCSQATLQGYSLRQQDLRTIARESLPSTAPLYRPVGTSSSEASTVRATNGVAAATTARWLRWHRWRFHDASGEGSTRPSGSQRRRAQALTMPQQWFRCGCGITCPGRVMTSTTPSGNPSEGQRRGYEGLCSVRATRVKQPQAALSIPRNCTSTLTRWLAR